MAERVDHRAFALSSEPAVVALAVAEHLAAAGVPARLLGGAGVRIRCAARAPLAFVRPVGNVDLIAPVKAGGDGARVLRELGFEEDARVSALWGGERRVFFGGEHRVDLMLGRFRMCHELDLEDRLEVEPLTLTAADLLLTKLQIIELTRKDVQDVAALLTTHAPADRDGTGLLNVDRIAEATRGDWGLYTTVTDNLERIPSHVAYSLDARDAAAEVASAVDRIGAAVRDAPKTTRWKARARIGRGKRWYAVPEGGPELSSRTAAGAPDRLTPVRVPAAYELVLEQLRTAIAVGDYLPEQRLPPDRTLAQLFDVSRTTVQQALRVLQGEGLVTMRRGANGGAIVTPPTGAQDQLRRTVREQLPIIERELEFRRAIEVSAAGLAAERRSELHVERLERSTRMLRGGDGDFGRVDAVFHLTVGDAAGNPLLRGSLEAMRPATIRAVRIIPIDELMTATIGAHERIQTAIREGDAADAAEAMAVHLDDVSARLRRAAASAT